MQNYIYKNAQFSMQMSKILTLGKEILLTFTGHLKKSVADKHVRLLIVASHLYN